MRLFPHISSFFAQFDVIKSHIALMELVAVCACMRSTMGRFKLNHVRTVFVTSYVEFVFYCTKFSVLYCTMSSWVPARSDILCDKGWSILLDWILGSCTFDGTSGFVPGTMPCTPSITRALTFNAVATPLTAISPVPIPVTGRRGSLPNGGELSLTSFVGLYRMFVLAKGRWGLNTTRIWRTQQRVRAGMVSLARVTFTELKFCGPSVVDQLLSLYL